MSQILDGKKISALILEEVKVRAGLLAKQGVVPGLATVLVGEDPASHVYVGQKIKKCEANPFVHIFFEKIDIKSSLIGLYNANNINVAIAIGKYFGVNNQDIKDAIENYIPQNNRSQLINKNSNEIILPDLTKWEGIDKLSAYS